ncbi:MAG TPA: hypothetical protein VGD29_01995 [Actinoplanes sp.]|jgi:hypothetical protein
MTDYVPGTNPPESSPNPHRPARRHRAWPYVAAIVVAGAALAAVFVWPHVKGDDPSTPAAAAGATVFTVNGTLALGPGQFVPIDGTSCAGTPAYKDLTVDATVTITDGVGGVLGTGKISSLTLDGLGDAGTCDLKFAVPGIPTGKGTYGIEVAHRGATRYDESKVRLGQLQLSVS